ncbi:MAG TPA: S8 family peptidase [Parasegetibacter sp.]
MNKVFKKLSLAAAITLSVAAGFSQESGAQSGVPKGWHLLDLNKDGFYGISLEKAYSELLAGKKSKTVIVAVIDSGIDTLHEDLKPVLWINPKEIPGNGIDDDKNGYVDDVYGWNFLGGKDGRNVKEDSYEAARVYHKLKAKFGNPAGKDTSGWSADPEYAVWTRVRAEIEGNAKGIAQRIGQLKTLLANLKKADDTIKVYMQKDVYTGNELEKWEPAAEEAKKAKVVALMVYQGSKVMEMTNVALIDDLTNYISSEEKKVEAANTPPKNYRGDIVKDNYYDFNDRYYGNPDVMANTPFHGTHVAGIIGAVRGNGLGIDGVADNVKLMIIRAVPDGDEHDKDIALAIRYAVDNGAKVINMSFGKSYSPEKHWVDDAVKYAESKGVLLVHAAGNDAKDLDKGFNYPNPHLGAYNIKAPNFITVGASGDPKAGGLAASFTNYGKNEVDVFAPGVRIYSTIPGGNTYGNAQGTSMASPVVAGLAALIFQYYPDLTPAQVKEIIEKSAVVYNDVTTNKPGGRDKVTLSDLSRTGGIVNAYEALKMAEELYGGKNNTKATKSKKKKKNRN